MTFSLQKYFLTYWLSVVLRNVKYINLLVFLGKSPYLCKYRKGYKKGCSATPPARSLVEKRRYLIYKNMDIQKLWGEFIAENDCPSFVKMANAVVEQLGGVDEDTILNSLDSCRNANDGYTGFCYPSQTCNFWNENKSAIIENMQELADDLGEDLITMIKGFCNFKNDESITYDAIGKALYAPFDENESGYIYDTFSKYALEEVANRFQNWWYEQDESEFN